MHRPGTAQNTTESWSFAFGVREGRELNSILNGVPLEEDAVRDSADVSISYSKARERGAIAFLGRIGTNFLRDDETSDFSNTAVNYGGGLSWSRQLGTRTSSALSLNVSRNFRLETLSTVGGFGRDATGTAGGASWQIQHRSSQRTTWTTGVGYNATRIASATPIQPSQLVLREQPFADSLTSPFNEFSSDGEVNVRDAEDDVLQILATEGLAGTRSTLQSGNVTLGMNRRFTERTSIGFNVSGSYSTLSSDVAERDGAGAQLSAYAQRTVGRSSGVFSSYQFQRSLVLDPSTTIHSVFGGFNYAPENKDLSITASAGASYFQPEAGPSAVSPVGQAQIDGGLTESTGASFSYNRQYSQAIGFGRPYLIDYVSGRLTQSLGRLSVTASAGASFANDPLQEDVRLNARRAGVSLNLEILSGLSAGTSFFALENERIEPSTRFDDSRRLWSYYLRFSTSWN